MLYVPDRRIIVPGRTPRPSPPVPICPRCRRPRYPRHLRRAPLPLRRRIPTRASLLTTLASPPAGGGGTGPAYDTTTGLPLYGADGMPMDGCCCGGCCDDPSGPSTLDITFASVAPCDCLYGCATAARLSGTFAGTFTLNRFGFPGNDGRCMYVYEGAYTATTLDLYSFRPNEAADPVDCAAEGTTELVCQSDSIKITIQTPPATFPPNTGWELWVELYRDHPDTCGDCGFIPFSQFPPPPEGYPINVLEGAWLFYANGIDLDICGGTVTVDNEGHFPISGPYCCGSSSTGYFNPNQDATVGCGGTATITL